MFSTLDSGANDGYYYLKHANVGCKLGLEFVFVISEQFEGRSLVETHFRPQRHRYGLKQKNPAMSPSSSVHCGQYDTTYTTVGCILRKAFADDTILGDEREPAHSVLVRILSREPNSLKPVAVLRELPYVPRT